MQIDIGNNIVWRRAAGTLLALLLAVGASAQRPVSAGAKPGGYDPAVVRAGHERFLSNCAFCHGRDAMGGESGPNLVSSALVNSDKDGDKIGDVVRNGRPGGMPKFNVTNAELAELVAFLHTQTATLNSPEAIRRRITLKDLLTGDAVAGKRFFEGQGRCAGCHSVSGDLAGIAKRYEPIKLETVMLYPENRKRTATVTPQGDAPVTGTLIHLDEFTVTVADDNGWQRSWSRDAAAVVVNDPAEAHLKLLPQYSDADVHNLFAYLESLH